MGSCYSKAVREEMVSRCRARKRYMKEMVKARQSFSASHSLYLRALKKTGSSLLNFATAELQHHHAPLEHPHAPQYYSHSYHAPQNRSHAPEKHLHAPKYYSHSSHAPEKLPHAPQYYTHASSDSSHAPSKHLHAWPQYTHAPPRHPHAPPPMSPTSISWTTSTTPSTPKPPPPPPFLHETPHNSQSSAQTPCSRSVPPPPPPRSEASVWDFWDPFMAPPPPETEEEWEEGTTEGSSPTIGVPLEVVGTPKEDTSGSEMAMVVSCKSKDLVEIIKELDLYFYKAAEAGAHVSHLLEVPTAHGLLDTRSTAKVYGEGKGLSPMMWSFGSCRKLDSFGNCGDKMVGNDYSSYGDGGIGSHHCTVERLYAWEKKLYQEVKNAHTLKLDHEKRTAQLRKLELTRGDYVRTEKTKKEVEKLESRMMVASQAIETTSAEIIKLRESELYPQLVKLVKGLMNMWRSLYEFHQVQTHIVKQLKYINTIPSMSPTSEIHRQSTLQLELEVQQWHLSFCHVIQSQRDYTTSLTGWLRLSLFPFSPSLKTPQHSRIYTLSEEWQLSMDRIPDKVASAGIKNFLTVIHAIVVQQTEEQKLKKKSEMAFKELEKRAGELRSVEAKYGPYSVPENFNKSKNPVLVKREKVRALRVKAEEEKAKHEKAVSVTRAMTMNNLQMGLPHVFEAVTGFANVCIQAYETVYNQAKNDHEFHEVKRLLP